MNIRLTLGISALLFAGTSWAQCSATPQHHRSLQWSEATQATSPDFRWQIVVKPILTSEDNRSPVLLKSCRGARSSQLLILRRSAEAFWAPDGNRLVIINQPNADDYELRLFDIDRFVGGSVTQEDTRDIDALVRQDLQKELGKDRVIVFYLPRFVSWSGDSLVLSVGGATSSGRDGPMQSYCYGFVLDSSRRRVRHVLSRQELKAKYGGHCQESP